MKAYGFSGDSGVAILLDDVAFSFDISEMREFAAFVNFAVNEMSRLGENYDHVHFRDFSELWKEGWPDVQLTKIYLD